MKKRTDMPMVGVDVFVFNKNRRRFLLGKRKGSHGAGLYSLPGGHLEKGETLVDCAIREVKEETGLDVESAVILTARDEFFPVENLQYATIYLFAHYQGDDEPKNMEPNKCEGWGWYDMVGFDMEDVNPPVYDVLVRTVIDFVISRKYIDFVTNRNHGA
jgi:8-oxo-dGTP diphosphatase